MKKPSLTPSLIAASTALLLSAAPARAHFSIQQPASWAEQDFLGNPQKSEPCGQADPGQTAQPTGAVTTYRPGQMITIALTETIFHPGHYRVSIAQDMNSLPPDPPVTPGSTPCGSTPINENPTLPLLADGLLVHSSKLSGPQTVQVQLPQDFTCDKCTLQITQFMSNHAINNPGGCYYHHCATVTIAPPGDGGGTGGDGVPPSDGPGSGGGCQLGGVPGTAAAPAAGLIMLALGLVRRRRA
ncbi:Fibroin heavy chain precursor protein [Cystobacter fuscus DSM 2262]|uniref:Fibroin heavy chain protein n=1 Tax=Cystobacter fuscus (strain ATCC 25194 / DSM 2262 / NBRC 100088 / M29) TaxID=1242864 RepID=S9NWE8_CYSF2|nr:SCE4755 family polysaccharide monooxygenase-like protein [Cystobacter fuscus]EPX55221.1 Fibroin heavy chain precursor protein [Cystobacter fuscus DSM 2262]